MISLVFPFSSVIMEIDYTYWTLRQDSPGVQKWTLGPEVYNLDQITYPLCASDSLPAKWN